MDVKIERKNGETFTLGDYDTIVKDFLVSSIPLESEYETTDGRNGTLDYGARHGQRKISVPIEVKAYDLADFPLLRDYLFKLLNRRESFYIMEMRRKKPLSYEFVEVNEKAKMDSDSDNHLVNGKRYLVRMSNEVELEQMGVYGEGEIEFETTELPFAESIGTTQDIEKDGVDSEDGIWGFGMGLEADDVSLVYTYDLPRFSRMEFDIFNAGNEPVHPFEKDFKIEISNVKGASDYLKLKNLTNESTLEITKGVSSNAVIVMDGATVTIDNLQALRDTTKEFIELDPGWNKFEIEGASAAKVAFDFRFYY